MRSIDRQSRIDWLQKVARLLMMKPNPSTRSTWGAYSYFKRIGSLHEPSSICKAVITIYSYFIWAISTYRFAWFKVSSRTVLTSFQKCPWNKQYVILKHPSKFAKQETAPISQRFSKAIRAFVTWWIVPTTLTLAAALIQGDDLQTRYANTNCTISVFLVLNETKFNQKYSEMYHDRWSCQVMYPHSCLHKS